ncbi:MAG: SBBP repeat-containing protein, partial [Armatimonadetes bacterium]|nr:SBBP repeat-containing protein [Armatimonadota bacterium]
NVPTYARVRYQSVYRGIDLVYYGKGQQLEYDFIVDPGADPDRIRMKFTGMQAMHLDARGDLILKTAGGEIRQRRPVVYQKLKGGRKAIPGRYVLKGRREVGFKLGRYEKSKPLVIDPVLAYSTYLGGEGAEVGNGIAVDSDGSAYVTGVTRSLGFPTKDPFQPNRTHSSPFADDYEVFVTKLNASGNTLLYSTYLGGMGAEEGHAIAVDASGSAYVKGWTTSTDFPNKNAFQPAIANKQDQQPLDGFVFKLNPAGSALLYSTYLGGSEEDNRRGSDIAVDASGQAYVTGQTSSPDFPIQNAFQTTLRGASDAFVTKLNADGTSLLYSTYLGGNVCCGGVNRSRGDEESYGIAVDASGNAYVAGKTYSADFPTKNAYQSRLIDLVNTYVVRGDAFVSKFDTAASGADSLVYSTYLGGTHRDEARGIAVDAGGNAYVTGVTNSGDFPTKNALKATYEGQIGFGGGDFSEAFLAKLNPEGKDLFFSTFWGGGADDAGNGIALDGEGDVYVTGETNSTNFPVRSAIQPGLDIRRGFCGDFLCPDAFITKFHVEGSDYRYSTYLGGEMEETGRAIAVDAPGNAYVTGWTSSSNFPTRNPMQSTKENRFASDAFIAKIAAVSSTFHLSGIHPNRGGNTGKVTATLSGAGFAQGATVALRITGQADIPGGPVNVTDPYTLTTTFDLADQPLGVWDVVVTNPDGASWTLPGGFTILRGSPAQGWVSIIHRLIIRQGQSAMVYVAYGNRGDTDGLIPIVLRFPKDSGATPRFPLRHLTPVPAELGGEPVDFSSLPKTLEITDPATGTTEIIIPLMVYAPPGHTGVLPIHIPNPCQSGSLVKATVGDPVKGPSIGSCLLAVASFAFNFIPGDDCIKAVIGFYGSGFAGGLHEEIGTPVTLSSFIATTLLSLAQCAASVIPATKVIKATLKVLDVLFKGASGLNALVECGKLFGLIPGSAPVSASGGVTCVGSNDPNDKIGPRGIEQQRYISGDEPLAYAVFFENKPDATAPALDVVITDQLDPRQLDFSTFSLGPITFGERMVVPPSGLSEWTTDVDLRPEQDLLVKIKAKLDTGNGLLTWTFRSVDPDTGEPPEDPFAGFLPPNKTSPEGEGNVLFTVRVKANLHPNLLNLSNQARIVFDTNAPIDTPIWRNTIDNIRPTSQVLPLDAVQSSARFEVKWSGTDTGSGVKGYTIYVSEDGGPYTVWLEHTVATSGMFTGKPSKSYAFFSLARDKTGNGEEDAGKADTRTMVAENALQPGDVNLDTQIDVRDAVLVLQHLVEILTLQGDALKAADTNGDTLIDVADAVKILRIVVGLP